MTSSEMNKVLKKLYAERDQLLGHEMKTSSFVAATTENIEEIRPEYDLPATNEALREIEIKIRDFKHRLNVFNSTHVVEEVGMTIDEILIYLPQQHMRVATLENMTRRLPRERVPSQYNARTNMIEYNYLNYDLADAQRLYQAAAEELSRTQIALDRVNTTVCVP